MFLVLCLSLIANAQSGLEKAIALYDNGNYSESLKILLAQAKTDKKDPEVWNFIGLNYMKTGDSKKATKAFKKAVKYGPGNTKYIGNLAMNYLSGTQPEKAEGLFDEVIETEPENTNAYFYRGTARMRTGKFKEALLDAEKVLSLDPKIAAAAVLKMDSVLKMLVSEEGQKLTDASVSASLNSVRQSLESCLKICTASDQDFVKEKMRGLDAVERYVKGQKGLLSYKRRNRNDLKPIQLLSKPNPAYTDRARYENVSGSVTLLVEFRKDGRIGQIYVVKELPYGLTESAIRAAKGIKFVPEERDGVPQTSFKVVLFNFTIH